MRSAWLWTLLCTACALGQDKAVATAPPFTHVETVVKPSPQEDISADCHYGLTIFEPNEPIRAVWIVFDRGRDIHELSMDADVVSFSRKFHLAMLLHGHCPGKLESDHGDMNMRPSQGLGPALFRALDQLAGTTGHSELSSAKLILLGFSGAGPLSARLIAEHPERMIAGIIAAPGHFRPDGIDTVELSAAAQAVPQMITAGGADDVSGTHLPYEYFKRYRSLGAPWTFVLQNHSPHCCTANLKELMLKWLTYVIIQRMPENAGSDLRPVDQRGGWLGMVQLAPTRTKDSFGLYTVNVKHAAIRARLPGEKIDGEVTSWLPAYDVAQDWLAFVQKREHAVLPLH